MPKKYKTSQDVIDRLYDSYSSEELMALAQGYIANQDQDDAWRDFLLDDPAVQATLEALDEEDEDK